MEYEDMYMEVAAPGVGVESTFNDGCYEIWDGTSMATPHISGLAAKYWSTDTGMNASDVRVWLQTKASEYDITEGMYAGIEYDPASGLGLPTMA